ncbi:DUF2459 domain-containing protein [Geomonas sp.]|uniref:DUF2459 domain-containing protein n=1 Tax=Geomonas sp. TaxID=2651584 RepID=UPI002B470D80|nr:DUF2459 domain-containing protein [Geomonas sp.]
MKRPSLMERPAGASGAPLGKILADTVSRFSNLGKLWLPLVASLLMLSAGCAGNEWKYPPATKAEERSIYVVSHGWHTGVVLSREELGAQLGFVSQYLREGRYYEFGWGEAEWYQAEKVTPWIFLKTVFWSNPSVMHVVSLPVTPDRFFSGSDVVELTLSETGLEHLKEELRASFAFDPQMRPYPLKRSPDGESSFFKGEGNYLIINTCNRWTAKVLHSGGVPMDTAFTLRAASVIRQARDAKNNFGGKPR